MKPPITDAEFEVVEAPAGMTWAQFARERRRQAHAAARAQRPRFRTRLYRWTFPHGWKADAMYVLGTLLLLPVLLLGMKLSAVIWFALVPGHDPYAAIGAPERPYTAARLPIPPISGPSR